jgi:phosphodiesterase/alkaline phosphatase D-like protein
VIASNGEKVENIRFEYGEAGKLDKSILVTPNVLLPNSSEKVTVALSTLLPNTKYWYRLKVTYKGKEEVSQYMEFSTKPELSLSIKYIYPIMADKVEVWGEVVSNMEDITQIRFEYGISDAFGGHQMANPVEIKAKSSGSVKAGLTQLQPNTKYYVRLKALHKGKEHVSAVQTFTTQPEYAINILGPTIKENSVDLRASIVSYKGSVTDIEFEFGKTPAYGKVMKALPASVGEGFIEYVRATLLDLDKDSVYYYRLKALQADKPIYSAGFMFRLAGGAILKVDSTQAVSANSTTFVGKIAPQGNSVLGIQFEYGLSTAYGDSVKATPVALAGYTTETVRASVEGLVPSTTYHYRIKSYANRQAVYSEDRTFTTAILSSVTPENQKLKVFPVPTASLLTISHERVVERIEVFDQLGRILLTSKPGALTCTLDLSGFPAGMYHLLIHDTSHTWSRMIIKQ